MVLWALPDRISKENFDFNMSFNSHKDWNAGFKRRNSTSVSSLKMKQKTPTIQVVVNEHKSLTNSVEEDEDVFGDATFASGSEGWSRNSQRNTKEPPKRALWNS